MARLRIGGPLTSMLAMAAPGVLDDRRPTRATPTRSSQDYPAPTIIYDVANERTPDTRSRAERRRVQRKARKSTRRAK